MIAWKTDVTIESDQVLLEIRGTVMAADIVLGIAFLIAVVALLVAIFRAREGNGAVTEQIRTLTGLLAVAAGDAAIVVAAAWGVGKMKDGSDQVVVLVSSAFTAVTAITTAYFGIRAAANTAQKVIASNPPQQPQGGVGGAQQPDSAENS